MNLDQLARSAADELRAGTAPDTASLLDDLRRTRTRRNALRAVAVIVAFLLVGSGVALSRLDHRTEAPTHPVGPGKVSNGAIVSSNHRGVFVVSGELDHLPRDAGRFSMVQFTGDGAELVYGRRSGGLVAMDVATGATRFLAPCSAVNCTFAAISPDGTSVALVKQVGGQDGVELRTLESGRVRFIPTPAQAPGWPRWSPDGRSLVLTSTQGLYLMAVDSGRVRLLERFPPGTRSAQPASWSPDGRAIAFLRTRPVRADPRGTAYTLMTVRADGTGLHALRELGRCYCVGIAPPAVAWSPDGRQIAVTVIASTGRSVTDAESGGLYSIRPDGTGWTPQGSSTGVTYLAWQPLTER
jgi:hypothetical protein